MTEPLTPPVPPPVPPTPPLTAAGWSWRAFWTSLALLSLLLGLWGLATPRYAVPDEPAHVVKAAAVVRGQLSGLPGRPTGFLLPPGLELPRFQTGCFAFQPEVSADCVPERTAPPGPDVEVYTQAAFYPPAYYALVGLPTLVSSDLDVLYAARGVSAALCAALLAAAAALALGSGRRLLAAAVGVAATPMALFLGASVNPSGPEIAAALALWTSGVVLATSTGRPPAPVLATAGLAGVVLALSRPISPFWLALIGLAVLVLAGRRRVLELARLRAVRLWTAVLVLTAAAQSAWVLAAGSLTLYGGGAELSLAQRLVGSLARTDQRLHQMVAWFGWLDTPAPGAAVIAWGLALVAVVVLGARRSSTVRVALLGVVALSCLALPIALEAVSAGSVGFYWQGRYTLPLAVGLPVLGAVLSRSTAPVPPRATAAVLAVVAVVHVIGFVVALGRYTVGVGGGLGLVGGDWSPPVPALLLAGLMALAALAWSAWLVLAPVQDQPVRQPSPARRPG